MDTFSVVQGFSGSTVVLTGATGYVGKLVLEQLFRTCPGIRKVYVVVRPLRDRTGRLVCAHERLKLLLRGPEFALLQNAMDSILQRIEIIPAALPAAELGLQSEDYTRIKLETNFIIHCAASIRFDGPIADGMKANFLSTKHLLEMASQMPNLKSFTHMSTAYVNSNQARHSKIKEVIYPLPGTSDPLAVAEELMMLHPYEAEELGKKLMRQWGLINTYFVAKSLTERLVMSYAKSLPICIMRPSIIGCVAGDPFPGHIGNGSGFTAMLFGWLTGIIKHVQYRPEHTVALVPGDVVSSGTLVATIATAYRPGKQSNIVHICSSDSYPLSNENAMQAIGNYMTSDPVPRDRTLARNGYQTFHFVRRRTNFDLLCFGRQLQLAAIRWMLIFNGGKRQANQIKVAHKSWTKLGSSRYDFDTFACPTTTALYELLSENEQSSFKPIWREDTGDSWSRYLRTYTAGVKHRYLKEPPVQMEGHDFRPR